MAPTATPLPTGREVAGHIHATGNWDVFDPVAEFANYDADIRPGHVPAFLNIWCHKPGQNYGYIAAHHFLETVGEGNQFVTTDHTGAGARLFEKLEQDGLIRKMEKGGSLAYPHRYEIIGDPRENLRRFSETAPSVSAAIIQELSAAKLAP